VFDLLHAGHVRYLSAARAEGDRLVVGVNTDETVRAAKGPDRPVHPAAERAELVAALKVVDLVVVFPEATPAALIDAVQPDVLVKGADWPLDQIVGRETVWAKGGRVVRVPTELGHSTTGLIGKIRQ
jgi:rfaE bifunctional protein nucleotidyltransferase chain/domain